MKSHFRKYLIGILVSFTIILFTTATIYGQSSEEQRLNKQYEVALNTYNNAQSQYQSLSNKYPSFIIHGKIIYRGTNLQIWGTSAGPASDMSAPGWLTTNNNIIVLNPNLSDIRYDWYTSRHYFLGQEQGIGNWGQPISINVYGSAPASLQNAKNKKDAASNKLDVAKQKLNAFQESKIRLSVNKKMLPTSVAPKIIDGTVMVPLRIISDELGIQLDWDKSNQKISGQKNNIKFYMYLDKKVAGVNEKAMNLAVAPKVINGTTLVPLRFVAETFGYNVNWNKQDNIVEIEAHIPKKDKQESKLPVKDSVLIIQHYDGNTGILKETEIRKAEEIGNYANARAKSYSGMVYDYSEVSADGGVSWKLKSDVSNRYIGVGKDGDTIINFYYIDE